MKREQNMCLKTCTGSVKVNVTLKKAFLFLRECNWIGFSPYSSLVKASLQS